MASNLFGGGAQPVVTPPAPLPQRTDTAVADAARQTKLDEARRRGRRATLLTSGVGLPETANTDRPQAKTKLG